MRTSPLLTSSHNNLSLFCDYKLLSIIAVLFCCITSTTTRTPFLEAKQLTGDELLIDISHKFSHDKQFEYRGSVQIRSNRIGWLEKEDLLSDSQVDELKKASFYFVKAFDRKTNKTSETFVRACSLLSSDLNHLLVVNLNPFQEFINLNIISKDPECSKPTNHNNLLGDLKSELKLETGSIGPEPDTASFIRRQEEERKSKLRESKEDNKSFLLKYWMYILPAAVLLMVMSGGQEPERR